MLTVRLARPADLPRVDALRRASYGDAAWMPGIDVSSVETRHDGPGTVVFVVERGDDLLATTALKLVHRLAPLREELDAPVAGAELAFGPVAVSKRSAAAPASRGMGLLPLLRWYYVSAAQVAGAGAVMSGHVGGTPNLRGLERLGWEMQAMGTRVIGSLGARHETETWVARLPAARFPAALAALRAQYGEVLAQGRWVGPEAGPRLCSPTEDRLDEVWSAPACTSDSSAWA